MRCWYGIAVAGLMLTMNACGGAGTAATPPSDTDARAADTALQDAAAETAIQDATTDAGERGETTPLDTLADGAISEVGPTCAHPCVDRFGKNDRSLCPEPKTDWTCTTGCCQELFKCHKNADCVTGGPEQGQCTDSRYACNCNTDTNACFTWYCGSAADCPPGETCAAGACKTRPANSALQVRIVSAGAVLSRGDTVVLRAVAYDPKDLDVVVSAPITWTSDGAHVIAVDSKGVATGGATAGKATITAQLTGVSGAKASVTIQNVVPAAGATLTVIAMTQGDLAPVSGQYALVASGGGAVLAHGPIPSSGVISFDGSVSGGVDIHIFGDATDWVSWLHATGGVVYLPIHRTFWGKIVLDKDTKVVTADTQLVGANIISGQVDYSLYPKQGELELTLSSFPFSTSLFDFSLDSILGASVKRYFDKRVSIPKVDPNKPLEIPGGVTFALSTPAIPEFFLAAPRGRHEIWTIGGRITVAEVSRYADQIFASIGGGSIDFNKLVGALFPRFADFYSAITLSPKIAGDGRPTVTKLAPKLRVPMGLHTDVMVPKLPTIMKAKDGTPLYADSVFLLSGAVTANDLFVPLGLNAGTDTANPTTNPPDGIVDGDPSTPGQDPLSVPIAPMHSGIGGPYSAYSLAMVAASLGTMKNDPRPMGASAVLYRAKPATTPKATTQVEAFLPFAVKSTWTPSSRIVVVTPVKGSDIQRVFFKGKTGQNWAIWLNGVKTYTIPKPADLIGGTPTDRTTNPALVLISSFDLASGITPADLVKPGDATLDKLIGVVDRASFVDVH